MIKGMTGFGHSNFSAWKVKGLIEIKSQNHRFFDVAYYLPVGFASVENKIRQILQQNFQRGRLIVSLKIVAKPSPKLVFNKDAVREYLQYSRALKREFSLENNLTLSDLIRLPGVVEAHETLVDVHLLWPAIEKGIRRAAAGAIKMRIREGKSLTANIKNVLARMMKQHRLIKSRQKRILREKKKAVSSDEFVSFQKGSDINEEITRLAHYIAEFKNLLNATASVGKKLDFVAQEMQRETNTIGAKVQDRVVSNAVIALKSKIEKLREQAQNIE